MSTIVVVGDLHLDQSTAGVDRFDDGSAVLERAVRHAQELKATSFVFTGDLCDPHTARSHRAVAAMARAVHDLHQAGTWSVLLAGNHDVIEDGSGGCVLDALRWSKQCTVASRPGFFPMIDHKKQRVCCRVLALPFTPSSHSYDPDAYVRSLQDPGDLPVIVLGHLNLEGIAVGSETTEMPRGRDVFWPMDALEECFPKALLVGGHYHAAQVYNGVNIVGSAVRLRFDERENMPGYLVLEV